MDENYLITGATGFVGSCLTRRLVALGKTTHVISRKSKPGWRIKDVSKQIYYHNLDLRDNNLSILLRKIKPTYIFHLAAYGSLPREEDREKMMSTNVLGTMNLLKSLDFSRVKLFINTGSSAEYKTTNKAIKETDPLLPINDYGISKVAQTLLCQKEALQNNLPIMTFRLFSPYGYFEEKTRLIPHVTLNAIKNNDIQLASPTSVRDFIFIEDVVDAYLQACKNAPNHGEIFNLGSGSQNTVETIVNTIVSLTQSKSVARWGERKKQQRQIEPKVWKADITKVSKKIKWQPKYSLGEGLKYTLQWFKNNQQLYA